MMVCCLGIESNANSIGIGILRDGFELANIRRVFVTPPGEGVLPKDMQAYHLKQAEIFVYEALTLANVIPENLDIIAYTKGPDNECAYLAETLNKLWRKPIIDVNPAIAHIEMAHCITHSRNPIVLYASSEHTQVIAYADKRYRIFGETIDISVGNCLDSFAGELKLSNDPSLGFNLEQLAKNGTKFINLPYTVKGMHVSYNEILTHIKSLITPDNPSQVEYSFADLCFSLQETVFAMLVEITERAMLHCESSEVLMVGGVSCNKRLQEMMDTMCKERKGTLYAADERYSLNNGLMIAFTGAIMFEAGISTPIPERPESPRYNADQMDILWRHD